MRRITELDSLRGLASLAILIFHLVGERYWMLATAVDLFFVISGCLITGIILSYKPSRQFVLSFYARRGLRIWPIYYLCLAATFVVGRLRGHPGPLDGFLYYLTYLQGLPHYWFAKPPVYDTALDHTWTLAIEEQFYILWPPLVCLLGAARVAPSAFVLLGAAFTFRCLGFHDSLLITRMDGLALGALLAVLLSRQPEEGPPTVCFRRWLAGAAVVGLALLLFPLGPTLRGAPGTILGFCLLYFALVGVVRSYAGSDWMSVLRWPVLRYLGEISYGLYLYHWIIYEYLDTIFKFGMKLGEPWWLHLLKITLSFGVAVVSWHVIEKPLIALKDRFSYGERLKPIRPTSATSSNDRSRAV